MKSQKEKNKSTYSKMKAINFQVCLFLKCGPRVTCKFKKTNIFSGNKITERYFPLTSQSIPTKECSLVDKICIKNISSTVLSYPKKRLVCSFRTQIIKVTHTYSCICFHLFQKGYCLNSGILCICYCYIFNLWQCL